LPSYLATHVWNLRGDTWVINSAKTVRPGGIDHSAAPCSEAASGRNSRSPKDIVAAQNRQDLSWNQSVTAIWRCNDRTVVVCASRDRQACHPSPSSPQDVRGGEESHRRADEEILGGKTEGDEVTLPEAGLPAAASVAVKIHMNQLVLSLPTFGFVVGTRAALGVGIGLLLSGTMTESQRRALGVTLVAIGVATTIPAAMAVFHNQRGTSIQDS
jgi:hypothetical protein